MIFKTVMAAIIITLIIGLVGFVSISVVKGSVFAYFMRLNRFNSLCPDCGKRCMVYGYHYSNEIIPIECKCGHIETLIKVPNKYHTYLNRKDGLDHFVRSETISGFPLVVKEGDEIETLSIEFQQHNVDVSKTSFPTSIKIHRESNSGGKECRKYQ